MGFSSLIDILGSTLIGGMLFMILLSMNNASVENTYTHGGELIVQQNLVSVVEVLEHDFRKIAYCSNWQALPDPTFSILAADTSSITFLTDVEPDGIVDTMHYYLGSLSELAHTPNPRDRMLYRVVNSETPIGTNLGITNFKIVYYSSIEQQLTCPLVLPHTGSINSMQINLTVENPAAYDEKYASAFWRQVRLASRNLRNR